MNKLQEILQRIQRMVDEALKEPLERAVAIGQMYEQIWNAAEKIDPWVWINDIYRDDDGTLFAILTSEGKLYRASITVESDTVTLGEMEPVVANFEPATRTRVIRQDDGRVRWVSISATAVLNRVGEIDSTDLFDNFVKRAEETGDYPVRMFYHQGDAFRTGQADFLARDGAAYITSGLYDADNPLADAEIGAIEREADYWGESIGYNPIGQPDLVEVAEDIKIPVYRDGIHEEISILPQEKAAALFTRVMEVKKRMKQDVKDALFKLFDNEEVAETFIASVDDANREISERQLIVREANDPTPDPDPAPDPEAAPVEREVELDEEVIGAIVAQVLAADVFTELAAQIAELTEAKSEVRSLRARLEEAEKSAEERLVALERSDEDKQREWVNDLPARSQVKVTYRPREANEEQEPTSGDIAKATLDKVPNMMGGK